MSIYRLYLLSSISLKDYNCNSIVVFVYCHLREGINRSVSIETTPDDFWLLLSLSRVSCLNLLKVVSMVNWMSSSILLVSGGMWYVLPRVHCPQYERRGGHQSFKSCRSWEIGVTLAAIFHNCACFTDKGHCFFIGVGYWYIWTRERSKRFLSSCKYEVWW